MMINNINQVIWESMRWERGWKVKTGQIRIKYKGACNLPKPPLDGFVCFLVRLSFLQHTCDDNFSDVETTLKFVYLAAFSHRWYVSSLQTHLKGTVVGLLYVSSNVNLTLINGLLYVSSNVNLTLNSFRPIVISPAPLSASILLFPLMSQHLLTVPVRILQAFVGSIVTLRTRTGSAQWVRSVIVSFESWENPRKLSTAST